jgi:hypothetical protein
MTHDLDDLRLPSAADLAVETVKEVKAATNQLPPPALISDTVRPEILLVERRKCRSSVTDEAAGSMRVHAEQKRNEKMVRVPEGLKGLLSNSMMSRGVD